jgi:hypothetical protein
MAIEIALEHSFSCTRPLENFHEINQTQPICNYKMHCARCEFFAMPQLDLNHTAVAQQPTGWPHRAGEGALAVAHDPDAAVAQVRHVHDAALAGRRQDDCGAACSAIAAASCHYAGVGIWRGQASISDMTFSV